VSVLQLQSHLLDKRDDETSEAINAAISAVDMTHSRAIRLSFRRSLR